MTTESHLLEGCRPVPLAHYLKALGVFRLVAEQADEAARGWWDGDLFRLDTRLGRAELPEFFLSRYRPTPIVAPWNGGSGFYPKDNTDAIAKIRSSVCERFEAYRETIHVAQDVLTRLGVDEKVGKEKKLDLLQACRGALPEASLDWLDAAFVLANERAFFPPMLGTGGNDGRLDFTNNFMQRVLELFDADTGKATPRAESLLHNSLFDDNSDSLRGGAAIGQFLPGGAGGANATCGFESDSLINPWDFVLMLEGAAVFAVAAVRRLSSSTSPGAASPFTVRQSGVGYASASSEDSKNSRGEMWLPLWRHPAGLPELRALLAEGRARVGGRDVRDGVDFARAVATLGVDRGIDAFQRYGFQVRNGLAYFATPLERLAVGSRPRAHLIDAIDSWIQSFRARAGGDAAPATARSAARQLENAILDLCRRGDALRLLDVLVALGECERVMATSQRWVGDKKAPLRPIEGLSAEWLREADDGSVELRLAAALASVSGRYQGADGRPREVSLRSNFEPVATWSDHGTTRARWEPNAGRDVAWAAGSLERSLIRILQRRLLMSPAIGDGGYADQGRQFAELSDVSDLLAGRIDDRRLSALIWGCLLIDWSRVDEPILAPSGGDRSPHALYGALKLCFPGSAAARSRLLDAGAPVPSVPRILRLAANGDGGAASAAAVRRLRASGYSPAVQTIELRGRPVIRSAAALLFPLSSGDLDRLAARILRPTLANRLDSPPPIANDELGAIT